MGKLDLTFQDTVILTMQNTLTRNHTHANTRTCLCNDYKSCWFLGAFAKLRKATVSFAMFCFTVYYFSCRMLARSQYPQGPATGHLGKGFSWFPCV